MTDLDTQPKSWVTLPGRVLKNKGRMMVMNTYRATKQPNTMAT